MARTQNLSEYLTDIATAIKTKKGDETPINASKFDEEITNLPSGGTDEYFLETVTSSIASSNDPIVRCIKALPMINTTGITSLEYAFQRFSTLETIPLYNTSKVRDFNYAFDGCTSLTHLPDLNTSSAVHMSGTFRNTEMLEECPNINTSKVTSVAYIFQSSGVKKIPMLNFSKVTSLGNAFSNCSNLTDLGGFYNLGYSYTTTTSANNSSYTLDLHYCKQLTHDSLMNVINKLYDIKTKGCNTQKLNIGSTNLAKLTAEEIAIATNKGWTVS